jgi:transcriptional regulator with PAS, ATPase and Fis domain
VIVDRTSHVVWINDRYAARLNVDPHLAIGRDIEEIIPNSLMRQVVETGNPILLDLLDFGDQTFVVMRMPVRGEDGEVVGAVGFALFSHYESLKPLFERFSASCRPNWSRSRRSWPRPGVPSTPSPPSSATAPPPWR